MSDQVQPSKKKRAMRVTVPFWHLAFLYFLIGLQCVMTAVHGANLSILVLGAVAAWYFGCIIHLLILVRRARKKGTPSPIDPFTGRSDPDF